MRPSSFLSIAAAGLPLLFTLASAAPAAVTRTPTTVGSFEEMNEIPEEWDSASPYLIAEPANGRALLGSFTKLPRNNQAASCIAQCQQGGWPIAGLEYTDECWCGSELSNGANLNTFSYNVGTYCPTARDAQERDSPNCGSAGGLNIFYDTSILNSDLSPKASASTTTYASICLAETGSGSSRLLNGAAYYDDAMSSSKCIAFCSSKGYSQAGTEYGRECYCGSKVSPATAAKSTGCTMTCGANRFEKCGGGNAINFYQL